MKIYISLLILFFLAACSLFFGEDDGLKRCNSSALEDLECGPLYRCVSVGTESICVSRSPAEAVAMLGVYLNKKTKICYERGHDFSGVRIKTHRMPAGIPDCERVWQTKQCVRCLSDVPFGEGRFEGVGCPENMRCKD